MRARTHTIVPLLLATAPIFAQVSVTTGHYDNARTGANTHETTLTPANVGSAQFGKLAHLAVSGCIFAQPLYAPAVQTPQHGARNLVFIATTNNTIYAYDADDFHLEWSEDFGTPFPSGAISAGAYYDFLDCSANPDDAMPSSIGIVGTPVIEGAAMYFVANTMDGDPANPQSHHWLHKIRLTTGEDITSPVEITGTSSGIEFDSRYHLQRPSLLFLKNRVYIAFASHHDETPYYGWMFSYDTNLQQVAAMNYSPLKYGAGIWQSGGGPATDGTHIFLNTGNDIENNATASDNSESILQIDPATLAVTSKTSFFPEEDSWDANSDLDLGASRVIVMTGTGHLISGSKYGDIFSINRTSMKMDIRKQAAARHSSGFDWTGVYNGLAYWNNTLFVWPGGGGYIYGTAPGFPTDSLKAYSVSTNAGSIKRIANGQDDGVGVGYQGAALVVSANGTEASSGIVWAYTPASNTLGIQPGNLRAYAATPGNGMFHQLWSNASDAEESGCSFAKFNQPLIANGKVFLPTASQRVLVYGLLPAGPQVNPQPQLVSGQSCAAIAIP